MLNINKKYSLHSLGLTSLIYSSQESAKQWYHSTTSSMDTAM